MLSKEDTKLSKAEPCPLRTKEERKPEKGRCSNGIDGFKQSMMVALRRKE